MHGNSVNFHDLAGTGDFRPVFRVLACFHVGERTVIDRTPRGQNLELSWKFLEWGGGHFGSEYFRGS